MSDVSFFGYLFSIAIVFFIASFIGEIIISNLLVRKIKHTYPYIYAQIKGNFDDAYIDEGGTPNLMHKLRLDFVIFSLKYKKEIGLGATITYIILTCISYVTLCYVVGYVIFLFSR